MGGVALLGVSASLGGGAGTDTQRWHVVPIEKGDGTLQVALPPLAAVTSDDRSGATWRQTGEIPGGLEVARGDFSQRLREQGWRLDKVIPVGRIYNRSEITLWLAGKHRLLLLLWEKEAGKCGFAWGEEK